MAYSHMGTIPWGGGAENAERGRIRPDQTTARRNCAIKSRSACVQSRNAISTSCKPKTTKGPLKYANTAQAPGVPNKASIGRAHLVISQNKGTPI